MAREKIKVTVESGTGRCEYQGGLVHVLTFTCDEGGIMLSGVDEGSFNDAHTIIKCATRGLINLVKSMAERTGVNEKELLEVIGDTLIERIDQLVEKKPEPKVTIVSGDKAKRVLADILRAMEEES